MNKKLINALLCGVAILSVSVFNSCKTDISDIETRLRAIEVAWADLKADLNQAVLDGLYITAHGKATNGETYDITLSDGKTVQIPLVEGSGTEVTVDVSSKPGFAIITIDGTPYEIPLGAAVSSLVYRPDYDDQQVLLGTDDVNVKFLAKPALSADAVAGATVKFADVYELNARPTSRAGDQVLMMVVGGKATLDGEYISVPIRALDVVADKLYSASIEMTVGGTTISSNFFPVKIADDYVAKPEELDATIIPDAKYSPVKNEDNSYTITVGGIEMLEPLNVKDFYGTTAPAAATYTVAPAGKQTGDAVGKQAMLAASLASDGTWAFTERPGTNFGATGFQIEVRVNDEVKARTNVVINDPLAGVDWTGGLLGEAEAEYGNRARGLPVGVSTFDIQPTFTSVGTEADTEGDGPNDWEILHGGSRDDFFAKWPTFMIKAGSNVVVSNNGERLVMDDYAAPLTAKSRGLYWSISGLAIRPSNDLGQDGVLWPEFIGNDGQPHGGTNGEWTPLDVWDDNASIQAEKYGITITADGILTMSAAYTGFCARIGLHASFEYAYGSHKLGAPNRFGLFFFNRRWWPTGATMPSDFVQQ